jgi:hypothetical protein
MENYIFLGTQLNTHFFLNISTNVNYTVDIPSQIYNVLIHEKFISRCDENVIIYSINKKCEIIIIQHDNNPNNVIFYKDNLDMFLNILLDEYKKNYYIITYDYDKKYYKTYDTIKIPIPKKLSFNNSTIVKIITSKPIY